MTQQVSVVSISSNYLLTTLLCRNEDTNIAGFLWWMPWGLFFHVRRG